MIPFINQFGGSRDDGSDGQAPSTPSTLVASSVTINSADLSWVASTDNVGVVFYNVFIDSVPTYTSVTNSYSLSGLTPNTTYSVYVTAEDAAGNESTASNSVSVNTADTTAPSSPTGLATTSIQETTIDLSWVASSDDVGVDHYDVYVDSVLDGSTAGAGTTYQVTGLTGGTSYAIYVIAVDAADNESSASTTINPTTATSGSLGAPSSLVASNTITGSTDLTWTAGSGSVGTRIYIEIQATGEHDGYGFIYHKDVVGTSTTVNGLGSNLSWNIQVTAIDAGGNESVASNTVSVTTPSASTVYTTEQTISTGASFDHNYEFINSVGRADSINDPQNHAVVMYHDGNPIVFDGCTIRTKDFGFMSFNPGIDLTIRNCTIIGNNPDIAGGTQGKTAHIWQPSNFVFENNRVYGLRGVWGQEPQTNATIRVENNLFFDVKGLVSDGVGGYTGADDPNYENSQACSVDTADATNTISVSYNYSHNRPYHSKSEDQFSMFGVVGSAGNRHQWKGNCIRGRYDFLDPVNQSGGSGSAFQVESDSRYVDLSYNVVTNSGNNPLSTSWAKYIRWYNNRLVSNPYLYGTNNTDLINQVWRGLQIGNQFWNPTSNPVTDSEGYDNYIWYPRNSGGTITYTYSDMIYIRPDATNSSEYNNTVNDFAPPPTDADEDAEVAGWWDYIRGLSKVCGPQ